MYTPPGQATANVTNCLAEVASGAAAAAARGRIAPAAAAEHAEAATAAGVDCSRRRLDSIHDDTVGERDATAVDAQTQASMHSMCALHFFSEFAIIPALPSNPPLVSLPTPPPNDFSGIIKVVSVWRGGGPMLERHMSLR